MNCISIYASTPGLPDGEPKDAFEILFKNWLMENLPNKKGMYMWNWSSGPSVMRPFVPSSRCTYVSVNWGQDLALEALGNMLVFESNSGGNPPREGDTSTAYTSLDGFVQIGMELFWFKYLLSSDTNLLYEINKWTNLEAVSITITDYDRYQRQCIIGYNPAHDSDYYRWMPRFDNPRFVWHIDSTAYDSTGIEDIAQTKMWMRCEFFIMEKKKKN